MLFLILPILNLLGINIFPGQDAFSVTVPFDKNEHYSPSAISILCCCIMFTNFLRKTFLGFRTPIPMKSLGLGGLAGCLGLSILLSIDTYHRVLSLMPKKDTAEETPETTPVEEVTPVQQA